MTYPTLSTTHKIVRLAAAGLLAQIALSAPLWGWGEARAPFPQLPVWDSYWPAAGWLAAWLGRLLTLFTLALVIIPFQQRLLSGALILTGALALLDLNHLQAWVYCYALIFLLILSGGSESEKINALRLLLASIYGWSGINKLTPWFAEDNFAWFCSAFGWLEPLGRYPAAGYVSALAEASLGFFLLWPYSRPAARRALVFFHLYLVATLLALDWNAVVIPWNIALAALAWVVFSDKTPVYRPQSRSVAALLILAGLFPALNFAHLWPENLSWKMYSNTQPEVTFFSSRGWNCTPARLYAWNEYAFDNGTKLLLDDWALSANHTPLFAGRRTFRQLGRRLCACDSADSAGLYLLEVARWNKEQVRVDTLFCRDLLKKQ